MLFYELPSSLLLPPPSFPQVSVIAFGAFSLFFFKHTLYACQKRGEYYTLESSCVC